MHTSSVIRIQLQLIFKKIKIITNSYKINTLQIPDLDTWTESYSGRHTSCMASVQLEEAQAG